MTNGLQRLAIRMIFLSQTVVGFLGNVFLLYLYVFLYFTRCTLRTTDLIIKHLAIANSLVLLSKGVPQIIATFELQNFHTDTECKLVFYVHRVGRGVCLGSICLLSIFQAVTISSRNSRWAGLKRQAAQHIGTSNILCWVLNMLINILIPMYVTGKWNHKNHTNQLDFGYCSAPTKHIITSPPLIALISCYDVVCVGITIWASGFMVFMLRRHKQQVRHIHSTSLSTRPSPESRITQRILVLVGTFVSFYTLSFLSSLFLGVFRGPSWWLLNTSPLLAACFPTLSPFVLMSQDPRIARLRAAHCGTIHQLLTQPQG